MTDAEIVKALECCIDIGINACDDCPFQERCLTGEFIETEAIDLINRLKTKNNQLDETIQQLAEEINRQKAENEKLTEDYNNLIYEKDLLFDEAEAQIKAKKSEIKEWKRVVETWLKVHEKDKAEIERLEKGSLKEAMIFNSKTIANAEAEAIKEFAERLKNLVHHKILSTVYGVMLSISEDDIDNLVKEMVGEGR